MQEVTIRLQFNRECLGSAKRKSANGNVIFKMPRNPCDKIMFLPSWWHKLVHYAAQVTRHNQGLVRKIDWDPMIDGPPARTWRRTIVAGTKTYYAFHEAFKPGDVIGINAILPDGLTIEQFRDLMDVIGSYRGISPFQRDDERYGTFEVLSVRPAVRRPPPEAVAEKKEACEAAPTQASV